MIRALLVRFKLNIIGSKCFSLPKKNGFGIAGDIAFKVAREQEFDLASSFDLSSAQIR